MPLTIIVPLLRARKLITAEISEENGPPARTDGRRVDSCEMLLGADFAENRIAFATIRGKMVDQERCVLHSIVSTFSSG